MTKEFGEVKKAACRFDAIKLHDSQLISVCQETMAQIKVKIGLLRCNTIKPVELGTSCVLSYG